MKNKLIKSAIGIAGLCTLLEVGQFVLYNNRVENVRAPIVREMNQLDDLEYFTDLYSSTMEDSLPKLDEFRSVVEARKDSLQDSLENDIPKRSGKDNIPYYGLISASLLMSYGIWRKSREK